MRIRPLAEDEQKYTYVQSQQISMQTENIGYLRGDFGGSGKDFFTTWIDRAAIYTTDEFKKELDEVVNALRSQECGLLQNQSTMREFVRQRPESMFETDRGMVSGFRVDTEKYAYLIRCNPSNGDYNFYCFCYVSEYLDSHIKNARQGIRFVDPHYKELFRIPDGGKIVITTPDGEKTEKVCRFVEEYHTEVGNQMFHICQFAELMQECGNSYKPVPDKSKEQERSEKLDRKISR